MPYGVGTVQGIFTVFSTKYEILLRDLSDVKDFVDTGQTIIYSNSFSSSPTDWTIVTPSSNKPWNWSSQFACMLANGYGGNAPCDTWLISPVLDLTNVTTPVLSFSTWTKYTDSGFPDPLEVKISTNYSGTGDPALATWSPIQCTLAPSNSGGNVFTPSGDISLSALHQPVYVAFRYRSSGTGSGTSTSWEVQNFLLLGTRN
jgi:hypothetical protein